MTKGLWWWWQVYTNKDVHIVILSSSIVILITLVSAAPFWLTGASSLLRSFNSGRCGRCLSDGSFSLDCFFIQLSGNLLVSTVVGLQRSAKSTLQAGSVTTPNRAVRTGSTRAAVFKLSDGGSEGTSHDKDDAVDYVVRSHGTIPSLW